MIVNFKDNLLGVNLLDRGQESIFYESMRTQWSGRRKFPCPRSLRKEKSFNEDAFQIVILTVLRYNLI